MSDVITRIRVKEDNGIRRFLYPLMAMIDCTDIEIDVPDLNLVTEAGEVVPCEWIDLNEGYEWLLQFAVSLAPLADLNLKLVANAERAIVPDSLTVHTHNGLLIAEQKRLRVEINPTGMPASVIYDKLAHLRAGSAILRNGEKLKLETAKCEADGNSLSGWVYAKGIYSDGCIGLTRTETTACKSWITVTHKLNGPKPQDKISFSLLSAITAPVLTCDFGVGGGTFGKLQATTAEEVTWETKFNETPFASWSLATAGRVDYIGEVPAEEEFLPQRWFHLIDSDKALAVAITDLPKSCSEMTVSLNIQGDVVISFRLGEHVPESVSFGVCYHFLNDVPAIAAATNPQSILLPPTVEVLPT